MKALTKTLVLLGTIGILGFMTSCQTASADAASAVTCDKCKTVWVQRPQQVGPGGKGSTYYVLKDTKTMACPDCESAAATFFKTGSLKHSCSHCGGGLSHCTNH